MTIRTILACVTALAMLAACSKSTPPGSGDDATAAAPAQAPTAQAETPVDRARIAEGMLSLIGTEPQCQAFRTELEEAGKSAAGPANADDLSQIVVKAHQAGCSAMPNHP